MASLEWISTDASSRLCSLILRINPSLKAVVPRRGRRWAQSNRTSRDGGQPFG
jgi:hypothetical protein